MTYTEYKKRPLDEITSPKIANKSALRFTKTAPPSNMQILEKALDSYSKTGSISTDENSNPNSNLKQKSTEPPQELSSLDTYFKSTSDKHNHPKQPKNSNSQTVADPLKTNPQNALTFHMLEPKDESIPNSNITTKTCSSPTSKESVKRKFSCIHTPSNSNIVETISPPENGSILSTSNLITALNTLDDISTVMMSMVTAAVFTPIPGDEIILFGLGGILKLASKSAKGVRGIKTLTRNEALQAARKGKDIISDTKSEAKSLAKDAFKKIIKDKPHTNSAGKNALPHYHDKQRKNGSHIFYQVNK